MRAMCRRTVTIICSILSRFSLLQAWNGSNRRVCMHFALRLQPQSKWKQIQFHTDYTDSNMSLIISFYTRTQSPWQKCPIHFDIHIHITHLILLQHTRARILQMLLCSVGWSRDWNWWWDEANTNLEAISNVRRWLRLTFGHFPWIFISEKIFSLFGAGVIWLVRFFGLDSIQRWLAWKILLRCQAKYEHANSIVDFG